ncbi:MAG: hypothetical protein QM501_07095 [Gimesia sp.]
MSIFNLKLHKTQRRGGIRFELPASSLVFYVGKNTPKGQRTDFANGDRDQPGTGNGR